jgi:hypothetical protein
MPLLRHYTRAKLLDSFLLALLIVCLPCICILGLCVLLSHCYSTLSTYELPSSRRKRESENQEREARQRKPWVLAARVEGERGVDALSLCASDFDSDSDSDFGEQEEDEEEEVEVDQIMEVGMLKRKQKKGKARETHWQQQSPLFALPLEIRNRVYEECIAGYTIHISTLDAYHRMAHTRCKTPLPTPSTLSSLSSTCACGFLARQKGMADQWGNTSLLHLLGTCRRMYVMSCFIFSTSYCRVVGQEGEGKECGGEGKG